MEGSSSRMLNEVWVKKEPLWEDSGGCEASIQVNYTSYEVKHEMPLVVFPEKVLSVVDERKDNSMRLKEEPCESNATSAISEARSSLDCHIKKELDFDSVSSNGFGTDLCSSQDIKKECIDGSYQADRNTSHNVESAAETCDATGYSGTGSHEVKTSSEAVDHANNVKHELGWIDSVDSTGDLKSDHRVKVEGGKDGVTDARASLYARHHMKMDLVVGPVSLQPSDAACKLRGSPEQTTMRDQAERTEKRTAASTSESSDTSLALTPETTLEQGSLLVVHKPKPETHACDVCNKEFKKMGKLTRHKKIHLGEKPYACGKCDKKFTRPNHLREHDRTHTGEMPYSCDFCGKKFSLARQLINHKITHNNVKPFTCDVCRKGFTQFGHLMTHKRLHTGEKPYTCEICKREFAQLVYLKEHIRVHSGVKEYRCDVCEKEFTRMGELRRHRLIHGKDKPYECATCKKAFKQSSHLKRHQLVHTKVKQFSCDICLKCFTQKSTLGKHKLLHSKDSSAVTESGEKVSDDKNETSG